MSSLSRNQVVGVVFAAVILVAAVGAFIFLRTTAPSDAPTPPANSVYFKGRMAADDVSEARDPTKHKHPTATGASPTAK